MGDNAPEVGESVLYWTLDGVTTATVVHVTFWDVVDLELRDGKILKDIRRIMAAHVDHEIVKTFDNTGRWERVAKPKHRKSRS